MMDEHSVQVEASHIIALLQDLGREDATCRRMSLDAIRGEPILQVCQAAIRALVDDKELVIDMAAKA